MKRLIVAFFASLLASHAWAKQTETVIANGYHIVYQQQGLNDEKAVLFYRKEGSRLFFRKPMVLKDGVWKAELKGAELKAPGVEYYIRLSLKDGSFATDPPHYPEYNPFIIQVMAGDVMAIELDDTDIVADQKPVVFRLSVLRNEEFRVYIDDVDISEIIQRKGDRWQFDNQGDIFSGEVLLKVVSLDGRLLASRKLNFVAGGDSGDTSSPGSKELTLRGNASLNLGLKDDSGSARSLALSGNLHAETEYRDGAFSSKFSGVNINYQRGSDPLFNLSSGFLLTNTYKQHSLQLGDVSLKGAPLVLSSFSRRGMLYKTEAKDSSATFFNVRTSPVDGWEPGVSFDDRQTYGLSWKKTAGVDKQSSIQLSLLSGKLKQPQTSSVGSTQKQPQSGKTAGVEVVTELGGVSISLQMASSQFDGDTSDNLDAPRDEAYEIKLQRNIYGLASSIGFHRYGANYATIANPNFSNDRQGIDLSVGSQLQSLGWSGSFSSTRDNVNNDPSRPVVSSDNSNLSLDFSIENWPTINAGVNLSRQVSRNEPDHTQRVKNSGRDFILGMSERFDLLSLNWSSSIGRLQDELDATKDSDTRNHSLSLGYQDGPRRINLNLSQNKTIAQAVKTSDLINLSADIPLFVDDFVLNSQFSYQRNIASDNSQNNTILGGSARVSWLVKDMWKSAREPWKNGSFSLNLTFNQTRDALNPNNNVDDARLLFEFSLGAPVSFENKWSFE